MEIRPFEAFFIMLVAELEGSTADAEEGLATLQQHVQISKQTGQRWSEADMHRVRGDLLLKAASNRHQAAEQAFGQSIAIARSQHAKAFELRATTSLARLWRDQGKRTEARDLLAPVYNWFTEGHDTPVLKEAKALLEQLSA
jgi:predicted ATPase